MDGFIEEVVKVSTEKHPRKTDHVIQYGTAGFRTKGDILDHVVYRMGVLAVLRAKLKSASIGIMITASHNPEEDNGLKLVDPLGEMLEFSWESIASQLANVSDSDLGSCLQKVVSSLGGYQLTEGKVILARDTRPSSVKLANAVRDGIAAAGGICSDYGVLTTPQLHYMVRCVNTSGEYGEPSETGYYRKLTNSFNTLHKQFSGSEADESLVTVDGANGVGAVKLREITDALFVSLKVNLCNDGSTGKLNHMCGADYVKVQQKGPEGLTLEPGKRYASFDGDADRIVYYFLDKENRFKLMDGDKIATLTAGFLKELVSQSGLDLNLGLVQTAYANGSSTRYITNTMRIPVACVPTGVKHLHHKALDYDIGVYFEANGHGTVLFSNDAINKIKAAASVEGDASHQAAAKTLDLVIDLINQTVGDAISDMLLVETILCYRGWNIDMWDSAYTDLPNRQLKVKVKDRAAITTADAERTAVTPAGLQDGINTLVSSYNMARSFVRPSGTEDVVRIYAEADTQMNADMLAYEVSVKVYEMAGGVGPAPDPPKS